MGGAEDWEDLFRVPTPEEDDRAFILEITTNATLPYLDSDIARDFFRRDLDLQNAHYDQEEKDALLELRSGRHLCYARHLSHKN